MLYMTHQRVSKAALNDKSPSIMSRAKQVSRLSVRLSVWGKRSSVVPPTVLKPVMASQPRKDGDQDADGDEEAQRNHPYPQPIAFALFL